MMITESSNTPNRQDLDLVRYLIFLLILSNMKFWLYIYIYIFVCKTFTLIMQCSSSITDTSTQVH